MPDSPTSAESELDAFMVKFEHELGLHVAALDKQFDGRLGDRRASLKRNMAKFTRYYVTKLLAEAYEQGYKQGVADEIECVETSGEHIDLNQPHKDGSQHE